uniref:Tektin n=1 Tax=Papio anubis TaxID=9555 RepID=A0A8I5NI55_PAPAN
MAQTDVLLTKEPAPQTVPPCELPAKEYEVARNTGAYTSSGLATAGFRTAKYLLEEWFQNCYARYHQAFADRDQSERQRHESQQLASETQALAQRTQQDSTRRVGERLQDMHGWKSELQREVEALAAETDLLLAQKQRLERALDATEVPFSIATDNLQCRERRQHPNLVRDHVETELLKEAELIRNIQELLKRTIMQAVSQIRLNRERKETCEMDWSDKVEAYNIDETCGRYHSQSTQVQAHPHSTAFQESASTPETWAKFTQDNLCRAQRERLASANLRVLVDCILRDTSEDLRLQCDAVNLAFGRRCEELEDARHKLQQHLHKAGERGGGTEHVPRSAAGEASRSRAVPAQPRGHPHEPGEGHHRHDQQSLHRPPEVHGPSYSLPHHPAVGWLPVSRCHGASPPSPQTNSTLAFCTVCVCPVGPRLAVHLNWPLGPL